MATKQQQQQQNEVNLNALTNTDRRDEVIVAANAFLSNCLSEMNLHLSIPALKSKTRGKVRDIYDGEDYLVLVTTDRQSAFDRVLASIPFKGQVAQCCLTVSSTVTSFPPLDPPVQPPNSVPKKEPQNDGMSK